MVERICPKPARFLTNQLLKNTGEIDMKKTEIIVFALLFLCFAGCKPKMPNASPQALPEDELLPEMKTPSYVFYRDESGTLELPINGASGYAAVDLLLYDDADKNALATYLLKAGQGFTILEEKNDWWHISIADVEGWVLHTFCFINLPDIIPSIVYNNTNTYSSLFKSSGKDIPNITGRALYQAKDFNDRLGREEYITPVLYGMARKIGAAQQAALADGNTLIIYEAFRPFDAHQEVHKNLLHLYNTDPVVKAGISTPPWNIRWFLIEAPYTHQRGTAIDVSLGKIDKWETKTASNYAYMHVTEYSEYVMQTAMHELSIAAAVFKEPVYSRSETSWKEAQFSEKATTGTILLHGYLTNARLTPLASEWWHFNDLENTKTAIEMKVMGKYSLDKTYSTVPIRPESAISP
jgi:D-alanyl-D-alanine dipeptidase